MVHSATISHMESSDRGNTLAESITGKEPKLIECQRISRDEPDICQESTNSIVTSVLRDHSKLDSSRSGIELSTSESVIELSIAGNNSSNQQQEKSLGIWSWFDVYFGRNKVIVGMLFFASIIICRIFRRSLYCLFCWQERIVPEGILFAANSAVNVSIWVNNSYFCNASINNQEWNSENTMLNTTYVVIEGNYKEIADCLEWSTDSKMLYEMIFFITAFYSGILIALLIYSLTDLAGFQGMSILLTVAIFSIFILYLLVFLVASHFSSVLFTILTTAIMGCFLWWCTSIKWQFTFKWFPCLLAVYCVNVMLSQMSYVFVEIFNKIIVYIPLILTANEYIFSEVMCKSFNGHRGNHFGMTMWITMVLFVSEGVRFGSFLALYIGWKNNVTSLDDLLLNIGFSILGEMYSRGGIRDIVKKCLGQRIWFIKQVDDFPEVIWAISSIRQILELVVPATIITNPFVYDTLRKCQPVYDVSLWNQILFFTSIRLSNDIWDFLACYYFAELIAWLLCRLVAKWTSYKESSALRNLKFYEFCLLAFMVFLVSPPILPLFYIPVVMGYKY